MQKGDDEKTVHPRGNDEPEKHCEIAPAFRVVFRRTCFVDYVHILYLLEDRSFEVNSCRQFTLYFSFDFFISSYTRYLKRKYCSRSNSTEGF